MPEPCRQATAYQNRGAARIELAQFKEAIDDCAQAIRLAPEQAKPFRDRGIARSALGDGAGALADLDRAAKLEPGNAENFSLRAQLRTVVQDYAGAVVAEPEPDAVGDILVSTDALAGVSSVEL